MMKNQYSFLIVLCVIFISLTLVSYSTKVEKLAVKNPPNIILLIGDGMGLSQVSSAYFFQVAEPAFSKFPVVGLIKTSSSSHKITDSAAGATAFACGVKTYNGAIGLDSNERSIPNITEGLAKRGYASGLVATSSFTHATPASFFAHVSSRSKAEKIALQLCNSKVCFVAGGGKKYITHRKEKNIKNILPNLAKHGFEVDTSDVTFSKILNPKKKYLYALADDGMPSMLDGRGAFLTTATVKAIDFLEAQKQPFFLMVEGSQIDWGGHAKDADYLIEEVKDFNTTLEAVFAYAKKQGNTLVVVTADHETGGFTLASDDGDYNKIKPRFSTGGHSATLIPVFAYGPDAETFGGIYENTAIYHKLLEQTK